MDSTVLELDTSSREVVDLTDDASAFCRARGDGLLHVFAPHATAGLALMETGSGSEADLVDALARLLRATSGTGIRKGRRVTARTISFRSS